MATVGAALVWLWGWVWPDDMGERSGLGLRIAYAQFHLRVFWEHAGICWLAACVIALPLRLWKGAVVAFALASLSLGPVAMSYLRPGPVQGREAMRHALNERIVKDVSAKPPEPGLPATAMHTSEAGGITIVTANLLLWNRMPELITGEIHRWDPDVVVLQEYTFGMAAILRPMLIERYPYIAESPQLESFGQAVYSKWPFVEGPAFYPQHAWFNEHGLAMRSHGLIGSGDPQIRVTVRLGGGDAGQEVVIQNIHMATPYRMEYYNEQRAMVRWLGDWVASEPRPVIIAGDFNNTPHTVEASVLRDHGLVEIHSRVGRGRGTTWPKSVDYERVPGIRLDQVWARGLTPMWTEIGGSICSDHRPVVAGWVVSPPR